MNCFFPQLGSSRYGALSRHGVGMENLGLLSFHTHVFALPFLFAGCGYTVVSEFPVYLLQPLQVSVSLFLLKATVFPALGTLVLLHAPTLCPYDPSSCGNFLSLGKYLMWKANRSLSSLLHIHNGVGGSSNLTDLMLAL